MKLTQIAQADFALKLALSHIPIKLYFREGAMSMQAIKEWLRENRFFIFRFLRTSLILVLVAYAVVKLGGLSLASLDPYNPFSDSFMLNTLAEESGMGWWTEIARLSIAPGAGLLAVFSMIFSWKRRVKTKKSFTEFFSHKQLMITPKSITRYSDRMAYILAEMSELAYYEVEKTSDHFTRFMKQAMHARPEKAEDISKLVDAYQKITRADSLNSQVSIHNEQDLAKCLANNGFTYKPPYLNHGSAQGFICVHNNPEQPYIVVAFRGSEMKIEDWLTNGDAVPSAKVKDGKIHTGFYNDFLGVKDQIIHTLSALKAELGEDVPIFFTGHSLGGAVALVAARELTPDGYGACYTYGGPRVGDYEYFECMKTPVYRIVNSSDLVPRVPPGAGAVLLSRTIRLLQLCFTTAPRIKALLERLNQWVLKVTVYRHFGDLRYLTDVANASTLGKEDRNRLQLLRNPNHLDVLQWFWRHVLVSWGMPIKSHSLSIYRRKLATIGMERMCIETDK